MEIVYDFSMFYRAVLKCVSFYLEIYALTTIILAVREVDGELRSARTYMNI